MREDGGMEEIMSRIRCWRTKIIPNKKPEKIIMEDEKPECWRTKKFTSVKATVLNGEHVEEIEIGGTRS